MCHFSNPAKWNDVKREMIRGDCNNNARHALRNCVSRRYHHKISHFVCVFIFSYYSFFFFVFASYCSVCSSHFLNRKRQLATAKTSGKLLTINNVITYQFNEENGFVHIFILCCLIRSHTHSHPLQTNQINTVIRLFFATIFSFSHFNYSYSNYYYYYPFYTVHSTRYTLHVQCTYHRMAKLDPG